MSVGYILCHQPLLASLPIYENPKEVDPAGAELGTDSPATGHPVPGQVQDLSLTTSFVWSSLTILIN